MNRLTVMLLAASTLAACGQPAEKAEEVRPVRVAQAGRPSAQADDVFSGEVRARIETAMGFRVPGKLVSREVDVGAEVQSGQVLARLDAGDLKLDAAGARAQLDAARAQLELARSDLQRQRVLLERGHISQAAFDRYDSQFAVARSQVEALTAQSHERGNQAGYAVLAADRPGVVVAVEAEPGQVVQTGQPVIRLAQAGEREVAINVPEVRIARFHVGDAVSVASWAEPERRLAGRVREVAAAADPATRTYRVRVSVPDAPPTLRLGMSATVALPRQLAGDDAPAVPLTALTGRDGATAVWVVDPATATVARRPVEVSVMTGDGVVVKSGLRTGELVVVAGANLLHPGQRVAVPPGSGQQRVAQVTP
jgi:RND family efflux transporter MFP subunit